LSRWLLEKNWLRLVLIKKNISPKVSIGLPVFNSELTVRKTIESLLSQSFADFELIISDNASTDCTQEICKEYANNDSRIKYIRQTKNLGLYENFKVVLDEACGEFFMWSAADDIRSSCFIEKNFQFLSQHPEYVASTSKNYFEGEELKEESHIKFSIEGTLNERLITFLTNCLSSHGIFYSLIRTPYLKSCDFIGKTIFAGDWLVNVHLLAIGPIKRINEGYMMSGRNGISNSVSPYKLFQNHFIEYIFPLYLFSKYFIRLGVNNDELSLVEKINLLFILIRLNLLFAFAHSISKLRNTLGYKFLKK